MSFELPNQYQSKNGASYLGVALFGLTTFVLIYQIYFYRSFIRDVKRNGDVSDRLTRLERIIQNEKEKEVRV